MSCYERPRRYCSLIGAVLFKMELGMLGCSCHLGQDSVGPVSQPKDFNTRAELLGLSQACH